ncbi:hypothetical protein [Aquibacillus rhizosphaerae]|uniref:DUF4025 domain-containing protein n=1 Tax=Aquibacillus rhizosphaerae TaxID=3051431 RepID=A0ABT7L683_9BACI|nr:hypothetical protein [Aquibacillus sp. LR5S19]MDL4840710.1 hypothetical protein [Aquibacillus sp. LR5S19]
MAENKSYFSNKKKFVDPDTKDIEHQITYPGQEEFNLRNVSYSPGENNYLSQSGDENEND